MNESGSELLSKGALEELKKKIEYLTTEKRGEISQKLKDAISQGDLSENAEYQEAKDAQLMNEQKIAELENLLSRAVVVNETGKNKIEIGLGSFVILKKENDGDEGQKYYIVSPGEADPALKKISNESPLGKSLLGKKSGEEAEVFTPKGKISYTIVEIG